MIIHIFLLFIISIISYLIKCLNDNKTKVASFFSFISFVSLFIGVIYFFTGYNPLEKIKQTFISMKTEQQTEVFVENYAPPFKVQFSEDNSPSKENNSEIRKNYISTATITNIKEKEYRGEDNKIYITWTPIVGQETYKLKIDVDNPFLNETTKEFSCNENWYYLDVSEYPNNTLLFASVAVFDNESSQWIYSDSIPFTIY